MNKNFWKAAAFTVAPVIVGALSAAIAGDMSKKTYTEPPLSPPDWVFPVAWTILYLIMGYASWLVYKASDYRFTEALRYYVYQLFVNFCWSIVFFRFEYYTAAAVVLAALLLLVIGTAAEFYKSDRTAGILFIPYIAWLAFAMYLNVGVAILN